MGQRLFHQLSQTRMRLHVVEQHLQDEASKKHSLAGRLLMWLVRPKEPQPPKTLQTGYVQQLWELAKTPQEKQALWQSVSRLCK
jgi:hypothetical protein